MNNENMKKSFWDIVISRPIFFSMIFLAFLIGGLFAFTQLEVDLLPTVNLPNVGVTVVNPGMGADDIESLITKKLEKAFSDLEGIKHIYSTSREGVTQIIVEFHYGQRDLDEASIEVQRRINEVRSELPATIEEPIVRKLDPSLRPIMTLTLSAENTNLKDLRSFAENRLKRKFETLDGVASVSINGGLIRQINIEIDRDRAIAHGITLENVYKTLKYKNMNIPAGELKNTESKNAIVARSMGQFNSLDEIKNTVINNINGKPIYIKDIAFVNDSHKEARGYASLNGKPAVTLDIRKQPGSNTVKISEKVRAVASQLAGELPENMELIIARDDSDFIKQAIEGISGAAWQGFLLAFIIILLLLGNIKPTTVIFVSVPVSIISTFLVMWLGGLNISVVTLYALTISIGVNFDASVVMLENIFRHMENGESPLKSASLSIKELASPLLASTLTNIIVFLPLTQLYGYIGELMKAMAVTVIFSQFMALPVALFFTSNLAPRLVKSVPKDYTRIPILRQLILFTTGLLKLGLKVYEKILRLVIEKRKTAIFVTLLVFFASLGLVPLIGVEFMPRADQNEYYLDIETTVGSTLTYTKKVASEVERILLEQPELKYSILSIGGDSPTSPDVNKMSFSLKFNSVKQRIRSAVDTGNLESDIISYLRREISSRVPGIAHMQFVQPAPWWGNAGAPIEIKLRGYDWGLLQQTADKFVNKLKGIDGLFDIMKNTRPGKKEYRIKFNEEKLSRLGLSVGKISEYLRVAINGGDTWNYRTEYRAESLFREKDIYIVTRYKEDDRNESSDLKNVKIPLQNGKWISLYTIADITPIEGTNFISKQDKQYQVVVTVQTSNEPLNELILKRALPAINSIEIPQGITMSVSGEVTRMNDQVSGMGFGFGIAFLFIFMVLAAQFESLSQPIILMAAIPVMMIGVFLALFLTGTTLNTTTGNGIFALMGVVVNTSVILIDYINILRKKGYELKEAVIQAGITRFRPIIMTVATTFLAMLPMALSGIEGSSMYKPLAIAFMGGLLSSTVLTLIIVPVIYMIFEEKKSRKGI